MADRYYGLDRGERLKDVSENSSTTSKDVEIRIDLAPGMSRSEVLELLEYLEMHILQDIWPPA